MGQSTVYVTAPPASLFQFPPGLEPLAIPPPSSDPWIKAPFQISPEIYQAALEPQVPITFAACYIVIILALNAVNRSRDWKPWWVARTRFFTPVVAAHNLLLAAFSLATFLAMCRAIYVSWPEMNDSVTPAHIADTLCKINGPRGLGDAVTFDSVKNIWSSKNSLIKLASDLPDSTDVGRLWNEGLAFWGWTFYLSKFYEVLDTFVILARGKRSPTLQTYHHAGAMLCMWAGMRYMSPPIWMFVFLNSFIHSIMYVYYTLVTLGYKVPKSIKQTLTTMQIAQFVFGSLYAASHLFVQYDVPVTEISKVISPIKTAISSVKSVVSSIAHHAPSKISESAASATDAVTASETFAALIKRLLLRAAGDEGAAENIRANADQLVLGGIKSVQSSASSAASSVSSAVSTAAQSFKEETIYKTSVGRVNCIDTPGQSFAIWLNLVYLAPLTVLFLRFFVKAYITNTGNKGKGTRRTSFTEATARAVRDVNREADSAGEEIERRLSGSVLRDVKDMRDGNYSSAPAKRPTSKKDTAAKPAEKQITPSNSQHLTPESAIEDDEGEEEANSGVDGSQGTPSKKKKRNKKKKSHSQLRDAAHADENGNASFADVVKQES